MQINYKLAQPHFDRWLELWHVNLRKHFKGEIADLAHNRAEGIGARIHERVKKAKYR
jgi:hypothetical protein